MELHKRDGCNALHLEKPACGTRRTGSAPSPARRCFPRRTALLAAITERRLFVPLSLRDDVADLVVRQTDDHAVFAPQLFVDRRLDRRVGEAAPGSGGSCTLSAPARDRFRRGCSRDFQVAEPEPGDLRPDAEPPCAFGSAGSALSGSPFQT